MSSIHIENLHLEYPLYGVNKRSLKKSILNAATGGKLKLINGSSVSVKALNDISFSLKHGDRLGLIGHNGSGKSTLLRVLAGVFAPKFGKVEIDGKVASLLDINIGIQPELNGYENIKIRGMLLGLSKKEIKSLIPDIQEFTEIGEYLAMPIKKYSTGMAVRLAFALSTIVDPDILLIDEIFGAGDTAFQFKARKRMDSFVKKSNIVVMASHSNEIIKTYCNKVLWLEHGNMRSFGGVEIMEDSKISTSKLATVSS
ncbi:ABC transporter ATP-binding protein [Coxiella-like endosymbiont]|uniref:ABC transporter ATP-binding protein n=1 Tax=Coxiella-like endosymbiont TaxID=1592897 RepID=UPI00272BAD29|nr:ABC transporter ATP-binding protein [Coxiella-like endosymbiont]